MVFTAGNRREMVGENSHKYARLYRNIQPFDKDLLLPPRPWICVEKNLSRLRLSTIFLNSVEISRFSMPSSIHNLGSFDVPCKQFYKLIQPL